MKVAVVLLICCMLSIKPSSQISIECIFGGNYQFHQLNYIYHCETRTIMNIISPDNATITKVTGTALYRRTNDEVLGFVSWKEGKSIQYFPQGIDKFFKNLQMIYVEKGRLKEIHQADLKPFAKLISLSLENNDIENIEDGLFDFNEKLEILWINYNKIMTVGSKVFENLPKMHSLYLKSNPCVDMEAYSNPSLVKMIIAFTTENCDDPKYIELRKKITSLEVDLKKSNFESSKAILEKFQDFEKKLDDSRIEHFEALRNNLELLHDKTDNMADKHNYWLIFFLGSFGFLFVLVIAVAAVVAFRRNGGQVPYFS
ncbi:unnamed protein product [Chironomus riparius]|uniref:Uncharacterized protein n=1 Tax=Chironomus riparius TaxID=315576 RepID=A0A9N9S6X0_9DIPT|nr:unnamed protein product [Chironomus riparius]